MRTKAAPMTLDAEAPEGTFSAVVSVFGNVDSMRDRVLPGAFAGVVGKTLPVVWSHDWKDPHSIIGRTTNVEEIAPGDARFPQGGLLVEGTLDVGTNPKADQVAHLLRTRTVTGMSFAYDVLAQRKSEDADGRPVTDLVELDVHEVGPCLVGVNREATLLDAKAGVDTTVGADETGEEGGGSPDGAFTAGPDPAASRKSRLLALVRAHLAIAERRAR